MSDPLLYVFIVIVALIVLIVLFRTLSGSKGGEGQHPVSDSEAEIIEDTVSEFTGIAPHEDPAHRADPNRPPDVLTRIKGLGPKAAATLNASGVTHYEQIAAWDADAIATFGAKLGNRAERIRRDRWTEQAALLARGDYETFEAEFGKLGE